MPLSARLRFSTGSCQFPEDLMFEIFMWLPVNSLLRFRSVSKNFLGIIDSQFFIKEQARRSLKTKSDFQLIFMHHWGQPHYVDFGNGNSATPKVLEHPFYPNQPLIVGCCNGLICFRDDSQTPESYTLWNPSTRKYKRIESLPHGSDSVPLTIQLTSGFGYDQVKNDYKITRIDRSKSPYEMQIYSLNSNSWRKLEIQLPVGYYEGFYATNSFVQDAVYWVWSSLLGTNPFEKKLAAFHLQNETLHLLHLPSRINVTNDLTLIDLDDDLCIIGESFLTPDFMTKLTIWVMKESGNKDSWKRFDMDIGYPFALPNSNRNLSENYTLPCLPVTRGKLIAYDRQESKWFLIDTQQLKNVTSQGLLLRPSNMYYKGHKLFLCCKSLVQL